MSLAAAVAMCTQSFITPMPNTIINIDNSNTHNSNNDTIRNIMIFSNHNSSKRPESYFGCVRMKAKWKTLWQHYVTTLQKHHNCNSSNNDINNNGGNNSDNNNNSNNIINSSNSHSSNGNSNIQESDIRFYVLPLHDFADGHDNNFNTNSNSANNNNNSQLSPSHIVTASQYYSQQVSSSSTSSSSPFPSPSFSPTLSTSPSQSSTPTPSSALVYLATWRDLDAKYPRYFPFTNNINTNNNNNDSNSNGNKNDMMWSVNAETGMITWHFPADTINSSFPLIVFDFPDNSVIPLDLLESDRFVDKLKSTLREDASYLRFGVARAYLMAGLAAQHYFFPQSHVLTNAAKFWHFLKMDINTLITDIQSRNPSNNQKALSHLVMSVRQLSWLHNTAYKAQMEQWITQTLATMNTNTTITSNNSPNGKNAANSINNNSTNSKPTYMVALLLWFLYATKGQDRSLPRLAPSSNTTVFTNEDRARGSASICCNVMKALGFDPRDLQLFLEATLVGAGLQ